MELKRRHFLLGASALTLASLSSHAWATKADDNLSFLVLGDWGDEAVEADQTAVADAMAKVAEQQAVTFIISTGDNFYEAGVSNIKDPKWTSTFEAIYKAPALQLPWYAVLGNHDHKGNVDAELEYGSVDPRWNMPSTYYTMSKSVGSKTADFFFLDTEVLIQNGMITEWFGWAKADQLKWLEQKLAASTADWKIVAGHHPLFSGGAHGDNKELIRILKPLFVRYGVNAYLCGHDHDLEALSDNGVSYFVSGGGSKGRPVKHHDKSLFSRSEPGFLLMELSANGSNATFYGRDAKPLYSEKLAS